MFVCVCSSTLEQLPFVRVDDRWVLAVRVRCVCVCVCVCVVCVCVCVCVCCVVLCSVQPMVPENTTFAPTVPITTLAPVRM